MTLSELMQGKTPNADFEGFTTADDMVLAVNLSETPASTPGGYLVAQLGISEHSAVLETQSQDSQYIRTGQVKTKTGTSREITVKGERYVGDAFQDALLSHTMKYGIGQAVIKEYVYFNVLTGKGEAGSVAIAVEDDPSGTAGENAGFSASMTSTVMPSEYVYEAE